MGTNIRRELEKKLDKPAKKRQTTRKVGTKKDPAKKLGVSDADTYRTIHYYVRRMDSMTQILKDARNELVACGSATRLFCHPHRIDQDCEENCIEVVR